MDLRSALDARNRADRKDVRIQLLMAVPFTLFGIFLANLMIFPLIYVLGILGISPGLSLCVALFNAFLVTAIIIDVKRHPHESWLEPRYFQSDGSVRGNVIDVIYNKGPFGGMPLMTNVSDPHNLGQRGRALSSGFANLILGGPRSVSRALDLRRRITDRSQRRTVAAAERFTQWLAPKGLVPEPDVKAHLEAHPDQVEGLALARELEVVMRRRNPVEFHYHVR